MWYNVLVLAIYVGEGFAVPVSHQGNRTARQKLPTNTGFKPTIPKVTNTPGSGNKLSSVFTVAFRPPLPSPPPYCNCPGPEGWPPEQLAQHEAATNLKGGPYDCFCSTSDKNWLRPSGYPTTEPDVCFCPSEDGWTIRELRRHQMNTNISGSAQHCFCSGPNGFSVQIFDPRPVEVERCQCPSLWGWTLDELDNYKSSFNLIGDVHDCFCKNLYGNGYAIRRKPLVPEVQEEIHFNNNENSKHNYGGNNDANDSRNGFPYTPEDQNNSSNSSSVSESRLMVLNLNGKMKEIRVGPLWVKMQD